MIGNGHQQRTERTWKVRGLAKATGLTVRTLHHYDEIGLLQSSGRLAGGHRLYDADDVARLYRVIRLRQLGFPLSQVATCWRSPCLEIDLDDAVTGDAGILGRRDLRCAGGGRLPER